MNFTSADLKRLILPVIAAIVLVACGLALIWLADQKLSSANAKLKSEMSARVESKERLARISEEEREVKERIEIYRSLINFHIIGRERRLEWVDTIQRIRVSREMLDVRYRIEPQKQISVIAGKPGSVSFNSSTMQVQLALLHEGDLLNFLADLRNAGNAYVSTRECAITRSGPTSPPPGAPTLVPRLRAECQIDLITILDAGAKI